MPRGSIDVGIELVNTATWEATGSPSLTTYIWTCRQYDEGGDVFDRVEVIVDVLCIGVLVYWCIGEVVKCLAMKW